MVNRMSWPNEKDLQVLYNMTKKQLLELFFLHIKNLWRVDGLYFLGIEEKFGTEEATRIDANCWKTMGKIEARELKKALDLKENDIPALIQAIHNTSWALYQTGKKSEVTAERGLFQVTRCRTQETRLRKGLEEFPCKKVRFSYLESFAKEFNPKIQVICKQCPPDPHHNSSWCQWEFNLQE